MKEIKAYIRPEKAEEVIHALEEAGVPGFTVVEVKGLGGAAVPEKEKWDIEFAEKCCPVTKLEIVSEDSEASRIVDIIRERAHTGHAGDGMIFVSDVDYSIKIRTGEIKSGDN